jgi:lysophospholipase L1-like esterase
VVGLAATLLPLAAPVAAAAQADGHPVNITSPVPDARVDGPDVTVTGAVGVDASADVAVQFVADVSSSTSWVRGMDCDGDGTTAGDDLNADGRVGDVLDCEIAAVAALNGSLRARPASAGLVSVGLTGFAQTAQVATVDPDADPDESRYWVKPGDTEGDRDVIPRLTTVASSLTTNRIGQYVARRLTDGTNFDSAVGAAVRAFDEPAVAGRRRVLFLLSDGEGALSDSTLALVREQGVRLRTFAIGAGAGGCTVGSALARLAEAGQEDCVPVTDPATLTHALSSSLPAGLAGVDVEIDGIHAVAGVDSLGRWAATVPGVRDGRRTVEATARYLDGSSSTSRVDVTVGSTFQYVALGDSYASGEGVSPYIGDAFDREGEDFLCHRSWTGWPMRLTRTGHAQPIAREAQDDPGTQMDFAACSGARMVNLDTTMQEKNDDTEIPLQFDSLTAETDLVTVSIGGNDMGFAPIVTHCMTQIDCFDDGFVDDAAGRSISLRDWATIRLALMGSEIDSIYAQIRGRTRPDTEIVALTYPRLVSDSAIAGLVGGTCLLLETGERRWIRAQADVFAQIVHRRADAHGVEVADVREAFEQHVVCNRDTYLFPVVPLSRPDDLDGPFLSAASFHPNEKGVATYAAVVQDVLDDVLARPHSLPLTAADTSTENGTQAPEIDPLVVTDPETVLARYPAETVAAVAATVFTEVLIAAPHTDLPTCSDLVPGEHLPVSAHGFTPGIDVTVTVTLDQQEPTVSTATTGAAGTLCTQVPVPTTAGLLAVEVVGKDEAGGTVLGLAAVEHLPDSSAPDGTGTADVDGAGASAPTVPTPSTVLDAVDATAASAGTGAQEAPGYPDLGMSAVLAAPEVPALSPLPAAPDEDAAAASADPPAPATPRPVGVALPLTVLALLLVAAALVARSMHARRTEGRRA